MLRRWAIHGPAGRVLDWANRTHEVLADPPSKAESIRVKRSAMQASYRRHDAGEV